MMSNGSLRILEVGGGEYLTAVQALVISEVHLFCVLMFKWQ